MIQLHRVKKMLFVWPRNEKMKNNRQWTWSWRMRDAIEVRHTIADGVACRCCWSYHQARKKYVRVLFRLNMDLALRFTWERVGFWFWFYQLWGVTVRERKGEKENAEKKKKNCWRREALGVIVRLRVCDREEGYREVEMSLRARVFF